MRNPRRARPDINTTPLIDVLLVLLVIFMVTVPLTQKAIDADLPTPSQGQAASPSPEAVVLEYSADGRISVNREPVALTELQAHLAVIYGQRQNKTMYIIGAPTLRYKSIVAVMDAAKGAGVERIGIVTEHMRKTAGVGN